MKRLRRMVIAVTAGAALAYFFTTPRGRGFRLRGADLLRDYGARYGYPPATRKPEAAGSADAAVQAKIDETRRRLREELKDTLAGTSAAGTDRPPTETTA